jgi:DNA-binding MarR family transcriptional regulator
MTDSPDFAILLAAAYRALVDRLLAEMERAGIHGMRPAYGFVIRALAAESPNVNRLAQLLGVSKQAASKLADEMERAGFLERFPDASDRRQTRLRPSRSGRKVVARALATSAAIEGELRRKLGRRDVEGLRRALLLFVERHGGLEDVLARRARPVW